jgi:hypothetical protein
MISHLHRCRGFAVDDYSFALGRLGSGESSTFAQLGLKDKNENISTKKMVLKLTNADLRSVYNGLVSEIKLKIQYVTLPLYQTR